jgi:hemolysin activation/secretion protein
LLVVEQCAYGGRIFGRAYDPSALTGDNCLNALIEARYDLTPPGNLISRAQLFAFADHGIVERKTVSLGTPEDQWAASAGVGLRFGWRDNVSLSLEAGRGIGGDIDESWRGHFELTVRY